MHTSPASPCSQVSVDEFIKVFHDSGYSAVAVTNHFFFTLFEELPLSATAERIEFFRRDMELAVSAGEKYGMPVYQGIELRFPNENNNDYLLFGYSLDDLDKILELTRMDIKTFVKEYKTDDMLLIQAHPFRGSNAPVDAGLTDAVEVFNMHPNHNSRVSLAARFAKENGKIMTVGTDYHHPGHHNLSATRFSSLPKNTQELISAVKSNDFLIEIADKIIL